MMFRAIIIVIVISAVAGALVLTQSFYFSPKEATTEKGARILFESKAGESKAQVFEKIKKDLLEQEQFKNLSKNGDWPLAMDKLIKDKALPFIKVGK